MTDIYDKLFAEDDLRRRATVREAIAVKPDTYAAQKRDAAVLGVTPAVVEADPSAQQDAYARLIDADLAKSPSLAKYMASSDFARLAHDDVGALAAVEGLISGFANKARAGASQVPDWERSLYDVPILGGVLQRKREQYQALTGMVTETAENPGNAVAATARYVTGANAGGNTLAGDVAAGFVDAGAGLAGAQRLAAEFAGAKALAEDSARLARDLGKQSERLSPASDSLVQRGVTAGFRSLGTTAVSTPLAFLPGGQPLALGVMGTVGGGQSFQGAREQNVPFGTAAILSVSQGLIEGATEMPGLSRLVTDTVLRLPAAAVLKRQLLPEVVGEQVATIAQDFNDWAVLPSNQDKSVQDFIDERPAAATETLIAALIGVAGNAAVSKTIQSSMGQMLAQQRDAALATEDADKLTTLLASAAKSKLRDRDPDSFAQLVQQAAEDRDGVPARVYVDASVLLGDGESKGLVTREELAQLVPTITDQQIEEAVAIGGALELPIGDLAARVTGTPLEQSLLDHVRMAPEALSRAEAKAVEAQVADLSGLATAAVEQASDALTIEKERESVRTNVEQQLATAGRFTKDVNAVYAQITADFFTTMAGRMGLTPAQMYAKFPLRISGAPLVGGLEQSKPAAWYTGSTQRGLKRMSASAARDGNLYGPGVYVARDRETAATYARAPLNADGSRGEGGSIYSTSAEPTKPFDTANAENAARYKELSAGEGGKAAANAALAAEGYDAILFKLPRGQEAAVLLNDLDVDEDTSSNTAPSAPNFDTSELTLAQPARGTFNPSTLQISLLEQADLSTFLHELGHFGLEVMADLASHPGAPAGVVEDMAALLRWFGVKAGGNKTALDTWRAMPLDEQRASHEKFAEAFEQYLFEGKAPTHDLQALFAKVRAWMTGVYRSLKQFLAGKDSALTPSVRGVFDRMLASEDAIAEAQQVEAYAPLFKDANTAGMTPDEFEKYLALGQQATDNAVSALTARSLRDMRWVANARAKALAAEQKRVEGLRKEAEKQVRAQLAETPVERARAAVRALQKEELRVSENAKRDRAEWTTRYKAAESETREAHKAMPPEQRKLQVQADMLQWELNNPAPQPVVPAGDLQIVAEMNGFSGVDEMQQTLAKAPAIEQEVEGLVDKQLLEEHGDTVTPGGMQRAADESVHNEARARFIASGLKALVDGAKGDNGEKTSVNVLLRAAKQIAARVVGERTIRSLSVQKFKAAEARAGKAALEATAKGDTRRAIAEARSQMLNNQLVRNATATLDEVEKSVKYLRSVSDSKTLDPDYRDQIDALLERFDLKEVSGKQAAKRKALAAWVAEQSEMGVDPEVPAELLAEAYRAPYRDMTVDEFRGLVDTVRQIEHLGKLKTKLLLAKDQREFSAVIADMVSSINANFQGERKAPRTDTTARGRRIDKLKAFAASHIKAATWARIADGGKEGGPLWEHIILPANESADFETTERAKAAKHLNAVLKPWMTSKNQSSERRWFESVGKSFTRGEVFAMALNTGNDGNLQRLLDGERWTAAQLQPILATMTREDWAVVQKLWDHFDSYRPVIGAKQRRVYGTEPDWVQPVARTHTLADGTTIDVKGGYYPVVYDPKASAKSEEQADAKSAEAQLRGARGAATTRRSFTKSRADKVVDRPLLYSLSAVYNGTEEIIHDLAWHEWMIDTNRILGNNKFDTAMRETHGPDVMQQLKKWRDAIGEGEGGAARDAGDAWVGEVRRNVSLSAMGFSFMTAVVQVTGFAQSAQRIGPTHIARGLLHYIGNPVRAIREAKEKSEFMANRSLTQMRDLNEIKNRVQGDETFRTFFQRYGFTMIQKMQSVVDVPTWHGAYEKAIAAGHDEARAIALSDQAVRDAQGGGQISDLAGVERGSEYAKIFTGFYTFMNVSLNLGVASGLSPGAAAKKAADMLTLYVLPAMLTVLLKNAVVPGDDEEESLLQKYGKEQIGFLLGLFVGVRELQGLAPLAVGSRMFDYAGPAGLRPIGEVLKFGQQVEQGEVDKAAVKGFINLVGFAIGLPSAQINRTLTGAEALEEGNTDNPAALLTGYQGPK